MKQGDIIGQTVVQFPYVGRVIGITELYDMQCYIVEVEKGTRVYPPVTRSLTLAPTKEALEQLFHKYQKDPIPLEGTVPKKKSLLRSLLSSGSYEEMLGYYVTLVRKKETFQDEQRKIQPFLRLLFRAVGSNLFQKEYLQHVAN